MAAQMHSGRLHDFLDVLRNIALGADVIMA